MSMTNVELGKKIDELSVSIHNRVEKLEQKVCDIDADIRGNGQQGLKPRVRALEKFAKEMTWGIRIVVAAVLLEIIARLAGLI